MHLNAHLKKMYLRFYGRGLPEYFLKFYVFSNLFEIKNILIIFELIFNLKKEQQVIETLCGVLFANPDMV